MAKTYPVQFNDFSKPFESSIVRATMNQRQLEAFRATMQARSVSGAARELNLSQPSVTRLIADLERSVGFSLFMRAGRGMEPTPEARRLYRAVERAFVGLGEIRHVAESIRSMTSADLAVGAIPAFAHCLIPDVIEILHRTYDGLRASLHIQPTPIIVEAVQARQLEVGFISPVRPYDDVLLLHEETVPYLCLMPKDHPLAAKKIVDLGSIGDAEFVGYERVVMQRIFGDSDLIAGLERNIRLRSFSTPAVAALARTVGALALVDPFTAQYMESTGDMVGRPTTQDFRVPLAVIGNAREPLSIIALHFSEKLIEFLTAGVGRQMP